MRAQTVWAWLYHSPVGGAPDKECHWPIQPSISEVRAGQAKT